MCSSSVVILVAASHDFYYDTLITDTSLSEDYHKSVIRNGVPIRPSISNSGNVRTPDEAGRIDPCMQQGPNVYDGSQTQSG